jgi:rfaE bifunctional protein nucleotidyltransferase chain/domain
MTMIDITVVGDALLDVDVVGTADRVGPEGCLVLDAGADVRRPGGAALAAMFAAADGATVRFVTALSGDDAGRWLARTLAEAGVEVVDLGLAGSTPEKWRVRAADGTVVRVDRNCRPSTGVARRVGRHDVLPADSMLVADYGRGVAAAASGALQVAASTVPVVWDPHPRGVHPPRGLDVVTPNEGEARALAGAPDETDVAALAVRLARQLAATTAVTCGARGAVVADPSGGSMTVPGKPAAGDTCGAGDRLAARTAYARARGVPPVAAVAEGVAAATRFVATGRWDAPLDASRDGRVDAFELAAATRRAGGTVVTAGGCFDLLHAGHIELLEAARGLGDCLIVCLNSDRSIRRLKGPSRPIVNERDRRRVLEALQCVDAVAVFDEPTPVELLERLRPHVFAKGADYTAEELPERRALARWGGRVAILPLAGGRSTSALIELVREQAS